MKNREALQTLQGLRSCGSLSGIKFCYFIAKNSNKLMPKESEILKKLDEIKKEFAEKDEIGKFIVKDNQYSIKDMESFNKKVEEFMDSEINEEIELHKIAQKNLPDNITAQQMTAIFELIEE